MTSDGFTALREAIAAGPTPGPWIRYGDAIRPTQVSHEPRPALWWQDQIEARRDANLNYIAAACNAAPVLLAKLDRYKKAFGQIREELQFRSDGLSHNICLIVTDALEDK